MKKIVLLFNLIFLSATSMYSKNVVQISIPKTGTHLLMKCIESLTGLQQWVSKPDRWQITPERFRYLSQNIKYWPNHLFFNQEFTSYLNNNKNAFFLTFRDPRDQVVSFAFGFHSGGLAKKLSFNQLLMALITDDKTYNLIGPAYKYLAPLKNKNIKNINEFYQKYIPWLYAPYICAIRFEDLIGPKGGGTLEAQLETMKKIAVHLGISLTEDQLLEKANSLFGGTWTFRKGQIGSWKKHFTEEHKAAFKEVAGQMLIDLGYENSFDW